MPAPDITQTHLTDTKQDLYRGLPDPARARWDAVKCAGVDIDDLGLVVPKLDRGPESPQILDSLPALRGIIHDRMQAGQHVLYFPGSFDLIHVGHASYIMEGIDAYLTKNPHLKRSDLFVLVLMDDDELIRATKPAHLYTQAGDHPRPIECLENFSYFTKGKNPRALDLASLPIDLVGIIPAPGKAEGLVRDQNFLWWLKNYGSFSQDIAGVQSLSPEQKLLIDGVRPQFETLREAILSGRFSRVVESFNDTKYDIKRTLDDPLWSIAAWQLLIHKFLGWTPDERTFSSRYARCISVHDKGYIECVSALMLASRITCIAIDDTHVLSTSDLLKQFGWRELFHTKSAHFSKREPLIEY